MGVKAIYDPVGNLIEGAKSNHEEYKICYSYWSLAIKLKELSKIGNMLGARWELNKLFSIK